MLIGLPREQGGASPLPPPGLQLPTRTLISRDWEGAAGKATPVLALGSPAPESQSRGWQGGFGAERPQLNNHTGDILNLCFHPILFYHLIIRGQTYFSDFGEVILLSLPI